MKIIQKIVALSALAASAVCQNPVPDAQAWVRAAALQQVQTSQENSTARPSETRTAEPTFNRSTGAQPAPARASAAAQLQELRDMQAKMARIEAENEKLRQQAQSAEQARRQAELEALRHERDKAALQSEIGSHQTTGAAQQYQLEGLAIRNDRDRARADGETIRNERERIRNQQQIEAFEYKKAKAEQDLRERDLRIEVGMQREEQRYRHTEDHHRHNMRDRNVRNVREWARTIGDWRRVIGR